MREAGERFASAGLLWVSGWYQRGRAGLLHRFEKPGRFAERPPAKGDVAEYRPLYIYLRDRYATRVVMSFAEIEALLGNPLPATARDDHRWWDTAVAPMPQSAQSLAWTLAGRTAEVNVVAEGVVFDRTHPG